MDYLFFSRKQVLFMYNTYVRIACIFMIPVVLAVAIQWTNRKELLMYTKSYLILIV